MVMGETPIKNPTQRQLLRFSAEYLGAIRGATVFGE
jgi:hypothetical protein